MQQNFLAQNNQYMLCFSQQINITSCFLPAESQETLRLCKKVCALVTCCGEVGSEINKRLFVFGRMKSN